MQLPVAQLSIIDRALRSRGLAARVIDAGRDSGTLEPARDSGAIDEASTDLSEGLTHAEVVLVRTPRNTAEIAPADALVTAEFPVHPYPPPAGALCSTWVKRRTTPTGRSIAVQAVNACTFARRKLAPDRLTAKNMTHSSRPTYGPVSWMFELIS
jgi:hypothetical protein